MLGTSRVGDDRQVRGTGTCTCHSREDAVCASVTEHRDICSSATIPVFLGCRFTGARARQGG
jgi:hypothetical protein